MPEVAYVLSRKARLLQANITAEANTDAGATWGAGEATLANSLKVKVNSILGALRSAGLLNGPGKRTTVLSVRSLVLQTNITDEATADGDATYGQPEADLLNSMKAKVNSALTALRNAGIINGRVRYRYVNGVQTQVGQANIASISIADADATYTSGGAGEQGLANDIKTKVNLIITAMDLAGITV